MTDLRSMGATQLKITTIVDGTTLEGEITFLTSSTITVEMISPFPHKTNSIHLPYFAHSLGLYKENGQISQRGLERAHELLKELYREGSLFLQHNSEINEKVKSSQMDLKKTRAKSGAISPTLGKILKKSLKKSLRSNEIALTEYVNALKKIRFSEKEYEKQKWETSRAFGKWLRDNFEISLGVEELDKLLDQDLHPEQP